MTRWMIGAFAAVAAAVAVCLLSLGPAAAEAKPKRKLLLFSLLLSACGTPAAPIDTIDAPPQPSLTVALAHTPTPNILVIIETPQPTATLQIYIVESGDTISEIAEKLKIPQADLIAANPDVNPNALTIGQTLFIPDPSAPPAAATLTPMPVPITQADCHPTADSGNWCFALLQNNTANMLENISAQITLLDENNQAIAQQTAYLPLDVIAPHSALPVYAFFPNTPAHVEPQIQLLSAMPGNASRYLPAVLNHTVAQIDWGGKFARVSGQVYLPPQAAAAAQVWVAAVAYDKNGTVIGARRWEGGAIQPGSWLEFDFSVSSVGGEIEAVEFAVQAR
ncbi:MAG: LysM peptidoglycan-binding domain-containing protein [Chloroflexi bacterium]|nr:LysM peptidoglycan-binding domain-containing protein [Chloroflexota bacterium]